MLTVLYKAVATSAYNVKRSNYISAYTVTEKTEFELKA